MDRIKIIACIIALSILGAVHANVRGQELVFENQPGSVAKHPNFGPNLKHFCHPFFSTSLILPRTEASTVPTILPLNGQISLGIRYKLKLARPISLVTECGVNRNSYRLSQTAGRNFPDTLIHQSQSIRINGLFGGLFLRLRLGQRGNYLGNYIDLGVAGQASVRSRLVTTDQDISTEPGSVLIKKNTVSELKSVNLFSSKACLRVGFDRFSLIASYRLSRLLNIATANDLPDLEIGLEFSPVRY